LLEIEPSGENTISLKTSLINFSDTAEGALVTSEDALNINLTHCIKNPTVALISYKIAESELKQACFESLANPPSNASNIIITSPELKISYTIATTTEEYYGTTVGGYETTGSQLPNIIKTISLVKKGGYWTTYNNKDVTFSASIDGTNMNVSAVSGNGVISKGMIITHSNAINVETKVSDMDVDTFGRIGSYTLNRSQTTTATKQFIGIGTDVPLFNEDYLVGSYSINALTLSFSYSPDGSAPVSLTDFLTIPP
jgi:hypothetical protein